MGILKASYFLVLFVILFVSTSTSTSQAGIISNGSLLSPGGQFEYFEQFGQSFTTIDNNIAFSIGVRNMYGQLSDSPDNMLATLYNGEGFGGSILGTITQPINSWVAYTWVTFDFSNIDLTIGNVYTVGFVTTGNSPIGAFSTLSIQEYLGGTAYERGAAVPWDMSFVIEGTSNNGNTVPEPSAISLMGIGLLGFGLLRRKQNE